MADENAEVINLALQRVVNMYASGVPVSEIANIMQVSVAEFEQIIAGQEFQDLLSTKRITEFEEIQTVNEGWDSAEQLALKNVLAALQTNPDEEFSLRVAAVASKVSRSKRGNSQSVISPSENMTTVIRLQPTYVNQLQNNFVVTEKTAEGIAAKATNMLDVKGVKDLMKAPSDNATIEAAVNRLFNE